MYKKLLIGIILIISTLIGGDTISISDIASTVFITETNFSGSMSDDFINIGDYDGDGFDDIMILVQDFNNKEWRFYIFKGSRDFPETTLSVTNADMVITNNTIPYSDEDFGKYSFKAKSYDINGDGIDEIVFDHKYDWNPGDGSTGRYSEIFILKSLTNITRSNSCNFLDVVKASFNLDPTTIQDDYKAWGYSFDIGRLSNDDDPDIAAGDLYVNIDQGGQPKGFISLKFNISNRSSNVTINTDGADENRVIGYNDPKAFKNVGLLGQSIAIASLDGKAGVLYVGIPYTCINSNFIYNKFGLNPSIDLYQSNAVKNGRVFAFWNIGNWPGSYDAYGHPKEDEGIPYLDGTNIFYYEEAYDSSQGHATENFGTKVWAEDINRDNNDDLIVWSSERNEVAPDDIDAAELGGGKIDIFLYDSSDTDPKRDSSSYTVRLSGSYPGNYQFGYDIAVGDFLNADGNMDIAVSDPGPLYDIFTNLNIPGIKGSVYIFKSIASYNGQDISSFSADRIITGVNTGSNNGGFGKKIASGDINNDTIADLLIADEALRRVYLILGKTNYPASPSNIQATTLSETEIKIEWTDILEESDIDFNTYNVYYSTEHPDSFSSTNLWKEAADKKTREHDSDLGNQTTAQYILTNLAGSTVYYMTVTAEDAYNHETEVKEIVYAQTGSTNIHDAELGPNPSKNGILYFSKVPTTANISVYDMAGTMIKYISAEDVNQDGFYKWDYNADGVAPGLYFAIIRIQGKAGKQVISFTIMR